MTKTCIKRRFSIVAAALVTIASCQKIEPRKPVTRKTSSSIEASIARNKSRVKKEDARLEKVLDTMQRDFTRSGNGFYYSFLKQDTTSSVKPRTGDLVTISYNVVSITGDTIYRREELSPLTKSLEMEYGIFRGLRDGLKLMRAGDRVLFLFPSYTAYGYYGDTKRIGSNVPFFSEVELLNIEPRDSLPEKP